MKYLKARYVKNGTAYGRNYTFKASSEEELNPGDMVTDIKGSKLVVVDEPVDMEWIETYGADKVAVVKKYEECANETESM